MGSIRRPFGKAQVAAPRLAAVALAVVTPAIGCDAVLGLGDYYLRESAAGGNGGNGGSGAQGGSGGESASCEGTGTLSPGVDCSGDPCNCESESCPPADNVCCSEACDGVCETCNVTPGTCLATAVGAVEAGECHLGETCDGLRGCYWVEHAHRDIDQQGMVMDAKEGWSWWRAFSAATSPWAQGSPVRRLFRRTRPTTTTWTSSSSASGGVARC